MSLEKEYPILEFDPTREAIIEPENAIPYAGLPERCVICFFRDAIESLQKEKKLTQIYSLHTETIDLPVFKLIVNDVPICMSPAYACAPGAAVQLEELIAAGCRKFIVCGGAGILQKEITLGHLVLPYAAVRDPVLAAGRSTNRERVREPCRLDFLRQVALRQRRPMLVRFGRRTFDTPSSLMNTRPSHLAFGSCRPAIHFRTKSRKDIRRFRF